MKIQMPSGLQAPSSSLFFTRAPLAPVEGLTKMYFASAPGADGTEQKVLRVENMPIFRSGNFIDMYGRQCEFDDEDVKAMVRNFAYLRQTGILPDCPVRKGHPGQSSDIMDNLVGYFTSVRSEPRKNKIDGQTYEYLLGSWDVYPEDVQTKVNSGLFRNRSAEIGAHVDNRGQRYEPVLRGLAYVDMSAVEALNFAQPNPGNFSVMMEGKTMQVENNPANPATPPVPPAPTPPPYTFSIGGQSTHDFAAVQAYITEIENRNVELAAFQENALKTERENFVKKLAEDNKIVASQIDGMVSFAQGLSPEQYETWTATFAAAAPNPLFDNHGGGGSTGTPAAPGNQGGDNPPAEVNFAVQKGVIRQLARAGVTPQKIEQTKEFAQVKAGEPEFNLSAFLAS